MQHAKNNYFQKLLQLQHLLVSHADSFTQFNLLDEIIYAEAPVEEVFRVLCLASITTNGLRRKDIDHYRREITQTYGYYHLLTFQALIDAGLLRLRQSTNISLQKSLSYSTWLNTYPLVKDEVDEQNPEDIAYTYSGYGPLSVHIAYDILKGRDNEEKILKLQNMPGTYVDKWTLDQEKVMPKNLKTNVPGKRRVLVFFIGGCTYTELAAFRLLQEKEDLYEFTFMTTGMVTGSSLIRAFIPNIESLNE